MHEFDPPPAVRVHVLTLRFSPSLGAFDAAPLDRFVADKELLCLREHFFEVQGLPHLLCLLWVRLPTGSRPSATNGTPTSREVRAERAAPADVPEADRPLFEALRSWRSQRARTDGVPPYVVFNNRELAAIAAARPDSAHALLHLDGVGQKKVERYGREIVALTAPAPQPPEAERGHP